MNNGNGGARPRQGGNRPMPGFGPGGGPGGRNNARLHVEKPKNAKATIFRLLKYIGRNGSLFILLLIFMLITTLSDLAGPMLQQKALATFSMVDDKLLVNMDALLPTLATMAAVFTVSALVALLQGIFSAKLSQATVYTMRCDLFRKISKLPIRYTDTHRHGDLMSRMTNDVENVSGAISQSITALLSCLITLVGAFVMMLRYSWQMTLITLITVPVAITVSGTLGKFMRKFFVRQQKLLGQLNGHVEEMVTSYKTVVAYGKEDDAVEEFAKTSEQLRRASISARVWGSIMGPIMNFVGNMQYVALAITGGYLILTGNAAMSVDKLQAMLMYSKKFTMPINQVANQYSMILTALAGAERIFAIMDSADEIDEGTRTLDHDSMRGEISFDDLCFSYVEGEPVLKHLHLKVGAGQKVAIVGATGSGKTTIVNLLTRFYEPDSGRITVDGCDIREFPKEQLRRAVAIVLQDTVLFSDTIGQNIRYGKPEADEAALREAAAMARADTFIDRLPENYNTMLAESGSNLSQGQRQLLSIARAVLADPRILILDEATSSVDTRTEMHIQQAMVNLMKNRTSLIIAHRLSTIRDADKIVVLKDGVIAEEGSHDELLCRGGEYAKLYQSQFAGVAT